jgi:hypothetical protein
MSGADVRVASRRRLAIVAGRGRLPLDVAEAARQAGEDPFIIGIEGEVSGDLSGYDHAVVGLGNASGLRRILKQAAIGRVVLSGGINRRPELSEIRPPLRVLFKLPGMLRTVFGGGDDKVLRLVMGLIESENCRVVGAQDVVPNLLATTQCLTQAKPNKVDWKNINIARRGALALGRLDVGQGAVAVSGRIVALEGAEGTDGMLQRVADLRKSGRISPNARGALVKFCKPQQDVRADLPSIGLTTIGNLAEAGLSGVAVEAGRSLILDRDEAVAKADSLGLFIVGVTREDDGDIGPDRGTRR